MKTPELSPVSEVVAPAAVLPESTAIFIRPIKLAQPVRGDEQLAAARVDEHRRALGERAAPEPVVREPRAYPVHPPRIEGAVRRTVEPVMPAEEARHRAASRALPAPRTVTRRFANRDPQGRPYLAPRLEPTP